MLLIRILLINKKLSKKKKQQNNPLNKAKSNNQ